MANINSLNSRKYNFKESLNYIVLSDMELYSFFGKLNRNGKEIDEEEINKCINNFIKIGDEYIEKEKEFLSLKNQVEKLGFKLTDKKKSEVYDRIVLATEKSFADNGKYDHTYITYPILFDGVEITKDMIRKENNPYLEKYLEIVEKNKELDTKVSDLEEKIKNKEIKLKRKLFNKEKIKNEISVLNAELSRTLELMGKADDVIAKKEFFDNLTEEKRKVILEYLEKVDECTKLSLGIKKIYKEYIEIAVKGTGKKVNNTKWEKAFKKMIEAGEVKEEDIIKINKTIEESFVKINENIHELKDYGSMGSDMSNAIDWYFSSFIQTKNITGDINKPKSIK